MTKKKTSKTTAATLYRPFSGGEFKWPDDRTSYSASFSSRQVYTLFNASLDGVPTTTHTMGLLMFPAVDTPTQVLYSDVNQTLQDVNIAGTAYNGAILVPNRTAIRAAPGLIRCTGMGLRVTYEGTELNRAGRYVAGTLRASQTPKVATTTGTRLSGLSACISSNNWYVSPTDLEKEMLYTTSGRVNDGVFEAVWRPSKVPQYMSMQSADPYTSAYVTAPGVSPGVGASTPFNSPAGGIGSEVDQAALCFFIENDTTSVTTTVSNAYKVELVWHWEYIPQNASLSTLSLSPSPYDPLRLASILNGLYTLPTGSGEGFKSMDDAQPFVSGFTAGERAMQVVKKAASNKQVQSAAARIASAAVNAAVAAARSRTPARGQRRITAA